MIIDIALVGGRASGKSFVAERLREAIMSCRLYNVKSRCLSYSAPDDKPGVEFVIGVEPNPQPIHVIPQTRGILPYDLTVRKHDIRAVLDEEGGEMLDKLLRIGDIVGKPRPPKHESGIQECD